MKLIRKLPVEKNKNGSSISYGEFLCSFDNKIIKKQLSNGKRYNSCGCQEGNKKHSDSRTRLYNIWKNMKQRILNPNHTNYENYGGSGITIYNEWLKFIPFRDWSLANGYADNLTIDRRNTNGNYEPSNCHWITHVENTQNRRNAKFSKNKILEIRGKYNTGKYTQKELAKEYNSTPSYISQIILKKIWNNL